MGRKGKPGWVKKAAQELVERFLTLASTEETRQSRYTSLARKTAEKYKVKVSKSICKNCGIVMIPGKNAIVRIKGKPNYTVEYKCKKCGTVLKKGYSKEKKAKKQSKPL